MSEKERYYKDGGTRQMISIALPMVASLACDTVMVFTDRLFLARLSPELMNAAMGGGLTVFMMTSFFMGLVGYVTALTAQYLGAARKKDCAVVVTQAVILSFLAYPLILISKPLAQRLFEFMGVNALQMRPQMSYLNILLFGAVVTLLRSVFSGFFSGIGRTSVVMAASFIAMLANVGFNYVLIYGKLGMPAMGIEGAAYGTIAGGLIGLSVLSFAYFGKQNREVYSVTRSIRFDAGVFSKLMRFGSPAGVEMFLNLLAFNSLVLIFHSHGPVTATASTIVFNWDMVSFVPLIGIEIGVTSLVGRFMGAGVPAIAHKSAMAGLKMGLVYSLFVLILFTGFPDFMVGVFRPSGASVIFESAVPLAVLMVRIAALYVLVEAMLIVFIGALRGAGDTLWAMYISVSLHWAMVAVLYFILRVMGWPPAAGWMAVVLMFMVFSWLVYFRYKSGKWKEIRVVQREPALAAVDDVPEVLS